DGAGHGRRDRPARVTYAGCAAPDRHQDTVVTTRVIDGAAGVEENPKRGEGSTGRNSPSSTPSKEPDSSVTTRWSVAPYPSRRPAPALPRVRTPLSATRATGSVNVHHAGLSAMRAGTSRKSQPRSVLLPNATSRLRDADRTDHRPSGVSSTRTSSM